MDFCGQVQGERRGAAPHHVDDPAPGQHAIRPKITPLLDTVHIHCRHPETPPTARPEVFADKACTPGGNRGLPAPDRCDQHVHSAGHGEYLRRGIGMLGFVLDKRGEECRKNCRTSFKD